MCYLIHGHFVLLLYPIRETSMMEKEINQINISNHFCFKLPTPRGLFWQSFCGGFVRIRCICRPKIYSTICSFCIYKIYVYTQCIKISNYFVIQCEKFYFCPWSPRRVCVLYGIGEDGWKKPKNDMQPIPSNMLHLMCF